MTGHPGDADDAILRDLRETLDAVDPPPADMVALGRAVFGLRRLDDELAELVADSREDALATRDAVALERLLSFSAGAVSIDVQITPLAADTAELLGEVDPAPRGARVVVELLGADGPVETAPDAGGRFTVVVASTSAARIRLVRPGGTAVVTPWFAVD